ncbi:MAG: PaaI family thioesterase [Anaerolineaceae bacterium]|nr:MAG: PaaI family thioesterase [Anaerolineaceae bacterium]
MFFDEIQPGARDEAGDKNFRLRHVRSIIPIMPKTKQPNSRHCFICGLENPVGLHLHIYEVEPGLVETQYVAPDHFQGYPGVLHGGIVAALIDEISGRAHMGSDSANPRFLFTGKLEVKYRKNVPIGKMLKIIGKAGKTKGKVAEAWAGIYDAETNELLAEGTGMHINVPNEQLDMSRLEELGWKVYPD